VVDVPLPGTESLIPDTDGPTFHYLAISVARRDYLRALAKYDRCVWRAHKAGVTNKLIASASDVNEASIRDRLRRLKRQAAEKLAELTA
jgi:hypothetical protein